jgi:hypothetical protein
VPLSGLRPLDARHPLHIVRECLAKCPDTGPGVHAESLAFLGDHDLARALETDIATAVSALGNADYKAAAVMAGSVAEALLLSLISEFNEAARSEAGERWQLGTPGRRQPPADLRLWSFAEYIGVGAELQIIGPKTSQALDLLKEYRNLIHPGRAERLKDANTRGNTTLAVGAMLMLVDDLRKGAPNGKSA